MYSQSNLTVHDIASSIAFEINSINNDSGLLIPRMSSSELNNIINPSEGLMVFQTDLESGFKYFDGCQWVLFSSQLYSLDFNNHIKYIADQDFGNYSILIEMSSDLNRGINWSRSGDVLTFNHQDHGLQIGDGVYIRNTNIESSHVIIIEITQNTFNVITNDSGDSCGKNGIYQNSYTANVVNEGNGANNNPYGNIDVLDLNKSINATDIVLNNVTIYVNDQTENFDINIDDDISNISEIDLYKLQTYVNGSFQQSNSLSYLRQTPGKIHCGVSFFEEDGVIKLIKN